VGKNAAGEGAGSRGRRRISTHSIHAGPDAPRNITGTSVFDLKDPTIPPGARADFHEFFCWRRNQSRTRPKTQSALLEAMQERQVTIDRETCSLPPVFVVFATQNRSSTRARIRSGGAEGSLSRKILHGLPGGRKTKTNLRGSWQEGTRRSGGWRRTCACRFAARRTRTPTCGNSASARQRSYKQLHRQRGSADAAARGRLGWRRAAGDARVYSRHLGRSRRLEERDFVLPET